MKKRIITIIAVLLFICGSGMFFYPIMSQYYLEYQDHQLIDQFISNKDTNQKLYNDMKKYNQKIYLDNQMNLRDAFSFENHDFDFSTTGLDDDMIGYISIEAMDIKIPLYIGASKENMSKGATVLGETSMPIGGNNTNCVIAAHRGMGNGHPMFRNIEVLKQGDKVKITNLWNTLEYEVVKSIVILPDNIEKIKIIEGEDLITLITCHPYTQNYQRYVVYCKRVNKTSNTNIPYQSIEYTSSQDEINKEDIIKKTVSVLIIVILFSFIIRYVYHRIKR